MINCTSGVDTHRLQDICNRGLLYIAKGFLRVLSTENFDPSKGNPVLKAFSKPLYWILGVEEVSPTKIPIQLLEISFKNDKQQQREKNSRNFEKNLLKTTD